MFGGPLSCPKRTKPPPWPNRLRDINMPCQHPTGYAHSARSPNTNYDVMFLHYKQRLKETLDKMTDVFTTNALADKLFVQYFKHYDKKDFQIEVKRRAEAKLKAVDEALERRREKLIDILCQEERQFYFETVDQAQRGKESKLAEMKEKAQLIKAKREAERLKVVEEKRLLQYKDQNELLRPTLVKLHNIESKMINLQQMRENEAKRESERETDKFYHDIMMKDIAEKIKREEQDAIRYGNDMRKTVDTWNRQIRGKEILKEEIEAVQEEDRQEIQKNMQQLKDELRDEKIRTAKQKEMRRNDLKDQIELRTKFLTQRQKELDALDRAFAHLNSLELAKEQASNYEARLQAKRETLIYNKYVADLKQKRFEEEKQMDEVLQIYQNEILKKQDEIACRTKAARDKLTKEVNVTRAKQLEDQKISKEEEKRKEGELNDFTRKTLEIDKCLDAEAERLRKEEILQYRADLCKQIEFNKLMKEREEQEIRREQKMSEEEEGRYLDIVNKMVQDKIEGGSKHPFREVLEEFECYCREQASNVK